MPNLYIIAGCNGAGKTTASYTVLPEILKCKEFVNADSIAAGLSPFNPESVALEAGRLMTGTMTDKQKERKELFEKIKLGVEIARRKLVEERASKNENLIIGDKDGHFKSVPAKDLLNQLNQIKRS